MHVAVLTVLAKRVSPPRVLEPPTRPLLAVTFSIAPVSGARPTASAPPSKVASPLRLTTGERTRTAKPASLSAPEPFGEEREGNGSPSDPRRVGARAKAAGGSPADEMAPDLRGFLRATIGCSHQDYLRLTPEERRRCDGWSSGGTGKSAGDFIADAKRAAYGVEAEAGRRRLQRREGPLGQPVITCEGPQSNLGAPCLPDDALHAVGPH